MAGPFTAYQTPTIRYFTFQIDENHAYKHICSFRTSCMSFSKNYEQPITRRTFTDSVVCVSKARIIVQYNIYLVIYMGSSNRAVTWSYMPGKLIMEAIKV